MLISVHTRTHICCSTTETGPHFCCWSVRHGLFVAVMNHLRRQLEKATGLSAWQTQAVVNGRRTHSLFVCLFFPCITNWIHAGTMAMTCRQFASAQLGVSRGSIILSKPIINFRVWSSVVLVPCPCVKREIRRWWFPPLQLEDSSSIPRVLPFSRDIRAKLSGTCSWNMMFLGLGTLVTSSGSNCTVFLHRKVEYNLPVFCLVCVCVCARMFSCK